MEEDNKRSGWYLWTVEHASSANLSNPYQFAMGAWPDPSGGYLTSTSFYIRKKELATSTTPTAEQSPGLPTLGYNPLVDGKPPSSGSASNGLPRKAIAGLVVGFTFALLIITAGIIFILLKRRNRNARKDPTDATATHDPTSDKEVLQVEDHTYVPQEMYAQRLDSPVELAAPRDDVELPTSRSSVEGDAGGDLRYHGGQNQART